MSKKLYVTVLTILFLNLFIISTLAEAKENPSSSNNIFYPQENQSGNFKISDEKNLNHVSYINQSKTLNQRGCCSWHQGVCGCSSGRAVCCDGSLSPSCGC